MPLTRYQALDETGSVQTGIAFVPDVDALRTRLRRKGRQLLETRTLFPGKKLGLEGVHTLFHEMESLCGSGVTLVDALTLLARDRLKHRDRLRAWKEGVEAGKPLSRCLAETEIVHRRLIVKILEVGEATGNFGESLKQIAQYHGRLLLLRRKLAIGLAYPVIVLAVATAALLILTLYVIPLFVEMYPKNQVQLPGLTRFLLGVSQVLASHGPMIFLGLGGLTVLGLRRKDQLEPHVTRLLQRIPGVGGTWAIVRRLALLQVLRHLLAADVRVHDGLVLLTGLFAEPTTRRRLRGASAAVLRGLSLSAAFRAEGLLAARDLKLLQVGETTGDLAGQVARLAERYGEILDRRLDLFLALFEPVMILLIAAVVGVILVGLYMPMFDMLSGGLRH